MSRTPWAWMVLMVAAALVFSRVLACAAPFAGLAALAAVTLNRRDGLLLVLLAWAANQAVGFGLLHYPVDAPTLGWGAAIGLASLAGWGCARAAAGRGMAGIMLAPPLAFAAFEGVLLGGTLLLPSGPGAFAPSVVIRLFAINAAAYGVLLLARRLADGFVPTTSLPQRS